LLALGIRSYDPYGVDDWLPAVDKSLVGDMDDQLFLMDIASRLQIQVVVDLCFVKNEDSHYQDPNFFYGDWTTNKVYVRFRAHDPDSVGYYSALVPSHQPLLYLSRKDMMTNALNRLIGLLRFLVVSSLAPSDNFTSIKELFGHVRDAPDLEQLFPESESLEYWAERRKRYAKALHQRIVSGSEQAYSPPARRATSETKTDRTDFQSSAPLHRNEHASRITSGSGRILVPLNKPIIANPENAQVILGSPDHPSRLDSSTTATTSGDQWDNTFLSRTSSTAVNRIHPSGKVPYLSDAVLSSVQEWKKLLRAYLGQYQCDVQVHYYIEPTIAKVLAYRWNEARSRFPACPPWEVAAYGNPMIFLDWLQNLSPGMFSREFALLPMDIKIDCPSPYAVNSNPYYQYAAKVIDTGNDRCATYGTIIKALIKGLQKNWSSLANIAERWLQDFRSEHKLTDDLMTSEHLDKVVVKIGQSSLDLFSDQRADRDRSRFHVPKVAAVSSYPDRPTDSGRSKTKAKRNKFRKGKAPQDSDKNKPDKVVDKPLTKGP
jgi:hypothetical protein